MVLQIFALQQVYTTSKFEIAYSKQHAEILSNKMMVSNNNLLYQNNNKSIQIIALSHEISSDSANH